MSGLALLTWRAVCARPLVSALLALCVSVAIALPVSATILLDRFERSLRDRADSTPIVVGPEASRFDLVLGALYFRAADIPSVPVELERQAYRNGLSVIPLRLGVTVRDRPLVGVDDRYYAHRALRAERGSTPFLLGECALGSAAARALGLDINDVVNTDPPEGLDLASPTTTQLRIVGVFAPTGTPDEQAIITTLPSAWLCEGRIHGHRDATSYTDATDVIGRTDDHVALTGSVATLQRVDETNRDSFHLHGDREELPLSALLLVPETEKDETLALARLDALPGVRALRSSVVIEELLATVLSIKSGLDAIAVLFASTTGVLLVLVFWLSARLRADEMRTIRDIGAPRWAPALLILGEGVTIVLLGTLVGGAITMLIITIASEALVWL